MDIIDYRIYECCDCGKTWTVEREAYDHQCIPRNLPKAEEHSDEASDAVLGEGPTIDQVVNLLVELQKAGIYTLTDKAFGDRRYDDLKKEIIKKWIVGLSA